MPNPVIISNTSPLYYLHQIDQLYLLQTLYAKILVPAAVKIELEVGKTQGLKIPDLDTIDWISIHTLPADYFVPTVIDLGRGEAEVIAIGLTQNNPLLILDDALGRRTANFYKLKYTGTLGIILKAKKEGHLQQVKSVITALQLAGMWLDANIIKKILELANE
jgi:predicted nucleic acid-binding protein